MQSSKKYFYVKVIEARDIVVRTRGYQSEPFVAIKMNGHEFTGKKTTNYHQGREWWDKVFKFSTFNPYSDWIAVEVREKGFHLVRSDWLGEVQIRLKDYADGQVHQKWFRLGAGAWKHHSRRPKGCVHLAFQLCTSRTQHPFNSKPVEKILTYEEWFGSLGDKESTSIRYKHGVQKEMTSEQDKKMYDAERYRVKDGEAISSPEDSPDSLRKSSGSNKSSRSSLTSSTDSNRSSLTDSADRKSPLTKSEPAAAKCCPEAKKGSLAKSDPKPSSKSKLEDSARQSPKRKAKKEHPSSPSMKRPTAVPSANLIDFTPAVPKLSEKMEQELVFENPFVAKKEANPFRPDIEKLENLPLESYPFSPKIRKTTNPFSPSFDRNMNAKEETINFNPFEANPFNTSQNPFRAS